MRSCDVCGAPFTPQPYNVRQGGGRFCSRTCLYVWQRESGPKGEAHHAWKGHAATPKRGRVRAESLFDITGQTCATCRTTPARERHHLDGDPLNNDPTNVVFLCARCHHHAHLKTHCIRGHPLEGANARVQRGGERACRACDAERKREYRRRRKEP
jgi:hypothetical protein